MQLNIPERLLLGPGPSNVSDAVREALARPMIGHLDPAFLAVLRGPGRVWLQTMPVQNLAKAIMPYIPKPSSS